MTFAEPAWLAVLLLVPLFAAGAVLTARLRRKQWAAFAAPRLRAKLLRRGSPLPRWLAFSFLMVAVILLALGMARPQTTKESRVETSLGRNVMLALDLSRSMLVTDLKPDRLTQAKTLCFELMEALPSDRIGLIGFAGTPYLFAPLTPDHAAVREMIDQVDMDFIPVGGSDLEAAVELAIKTLKETGQKENALIVLSDGDETTGRMAKLASDAKKAGVYVFAIAVGTEQGDYVPNSEFPDGRHRDKSNSLVRSAINTTALKKLAADTGGRFAVATSAANIPEMVKAAITDMEQFEIESRDRFVPVEYFQWFVLPGILFLMASVIAGTRWRGLGPASAAVSALLMFSLQPARAGIEQDARQALSQGRNEEAADLYGKLAEEAKETDKAFRYRLAQGNAAYQHGDLDEARHAFSEALRSEDPKVRAAAHHGLGTMIFGTGWRRLSEGPAYPEVPPPPEEEGARKPGAFKQIADALLGWLGKKKQVPSTKDPMEAFDGMVRQAVFDWITADVPEDGETEGSSRFNGVLTDWVDAVKHFDSALRYDPSLESSSHNRTLTVKYLKRLREILEEVQENAQQIQPMPGPGEGPEGDQPGEGDGDGDQEGKGKGDKPPGEGGNNGDKEKKDAEGGDRPDDKKEKSDKDDKNGPKPGESPEDAARRILKENADFEKGALGPGRVEYRQPDKDW